MDETNGVLPDAGQELPVVDRLRRAVEDRKQEFLGKLTELLREMGREGFRVSVCQTLVDGQSVQVTLGVREK